MARLRLFAAAREAAGIGDDVVSGSTVAEVLSEAEKRYGLAFTDIVRTSKVWLNGEECDMSSPVVDSDEIAILPPVSGGAR
jgi:molybdopterin synthase sulfur carrier subunit